ncbi:protein of unknown function [Candidatus Nitrotoga arctica]|uniref:Uncharacterized protein n=1 Tax=Candidatus Nitrotoga arctica TaxID=453162 RepID=A0ABN8AL45_9PROT|nr:protein of unknown function [Candidatus Nitrotoga arctica]
MHADLFVNHTSGNYSKVDNVETSLLYTKPV